MIKIPTPQKAKVLEETQEKLGRAKGYVVMDYRGLTVAQISGLRRDLGKAEAEATVVKNTLFKMAATATDTAFDASVFEGPTAVIFTYNEPTEPVKVLTDFLKGHPDIAIKGGAFENQTLSADQVKSLAKIPSRTVLLGQFAGVMQAPMGQMAGGLNALASQFARLLSALAEKQGEAAAV